MTNPLLPIVPHPSTTIPINRRFTLSAAGDVRVLFLYGQPIMEFHVSDQAARDLMIVQLCEHGGVTEMEVARAFDISRPTVSRAKSKYAEGGVEGLIPKMGPKGPTKIKDSKEQWMIEMAREGRSKVEIGTLLGVNESAVRKALRRLGLEELAVRQPKLAPQEAAPEASSTAAQTHELLAAAEVIEPARSMPELDAQDATCEAEEIQPAAGTIGVQDGAAPEVERPAEDVSLPVETSSDTDPQNRSVDRALAHAGLLDDAAPVFGTARNVRSAGLLLAIPILVLHGVFADAVRIFGQIGPAFYGIRNVVATLLVMFLARINRPEHLKEHSPRQLGAVLGLDRAPEMKTMRRKIRRLAALGKSLAFMAQLARRHIGRKWGTKLWLFVDGHVSVYSGKRKLKKHHVTRLRISLPAVLDYWVNDERGDPVLAVSGVPKKGMTRLLPRVIEEMRQQGEKRPITVIFDREGWSPSMFARLASMPGICFLSYRKAGPGKKLKKVPAGDFALYKGEIDGQTVELELADKSIHLDYGPRGKKRKRLGLRQISRQKENGDQTHIVTNDRESGTLLLGARMFGRWSQENFLKYMVEEANFDGLWTYAMQDGDANEQVPNPKRKELAAKIDKVKERIQELTCQYGERALGNEESLRPTMRGFKIANGDLTWELCQAEEELARLQQRYDSLPAMVAVREALKGEKPKQVHVETRRLIHCFRIAAFRAESALRELLRPHYRRWRQDGRTIVQSMLQSSGDLVVEPGRLRVILAPQSAPHRTRALARLCEELNSFQIRFPGSDLLLNFSVAGHENVS